MKQQPRPLRNAAFAAAAGVLAGVAALTVVAGVAIAHESAPQSDRNLGSLIDAAHLPPLLTAPGEPVTLRYDVYCPAPGADPESGGVCDAGGTVYLRAGQFGDFRALPLQLNRTAAEGRYFVQVPADIAGSAAGFSYYAVLRNNASGTTMTLPAGGAAAPQRSLPLGQAVAVDLGAHAFGAVRRADARVVSAAWGDGPDEVGLEGGPQTQPVGASAFDVEASGTVSVLDEVNKRVLRFARGAKTPAAVPLQISGTEADMSVGPDGTIYVLESAADAAPSPLLRSFDAEGRTKASVALPERTAAAVRIGPGGPVALEYPSGQWMPANGEQERGGRPGRPLPGGGEVVVYRQGNEVRLALTGPRGVQSSWRITSATPIAEVQLAQPLGGGRLAVVLRAYTDGEDEFVALVLDGKGIARQLSLASADWAETAPLTRFRLVGTSLYQLGSTLAGIFVDRFDLGVS